MVKNKYIILPSLLFAWTIIFAHSVLPHHHHIEDIAIDCSNCDVQDIYFTELTELHDCDHDSENHSCHFHVDVLTQVSVDNIFIGHTENNFLNHISFLETSNSSFYIEFVSETVPISNYLRGPPNIS